MVNPSEYVLAGQQFARHLNGNSKKRIAIKAPADRQVKSLD